MKPLVTPLRLANYVEDIAAKATEPPLIRHLSDMESLYLKGKATLLKGDPLLYEFYTIEQAFGKQGELAFGLTRLNAGTVGQEYFMTHGHFHKGAGAEIYQCYEGRGLLLLQTREGMLEVHEFARDSLVYIPSGWGHRTVNVGTAPLVFGAIGLRGLNTITMLCISMVLRCAFSKALRGPKSWRKGRRHNDECFCFYHVYRF